MRIIFQVKLSMGNRQTRNDLLGFKKLNLYRVSITVQNEM